MFKIQNAMIMLNIFSNRNVINSFYNYGTQNINIDYLYTSVCFCGLFIQ